LCGRINVTPRLTGSTGTRESRRERAAIYVGASAADDLANAAFRGTRTARSIVR
jgi:hypothetical protein